MPNIGTRTMYIAVINPDLPTDVYIIPYCCKLLAIQRVIPVRIPPNIKVLFVLLFLFLLSIDSFISFFSLLSIKKIRGNKTIHPTKFLVAVKVNGPTYSIPTLCATNAVPHIVAAINNRSDCLSTNLFIFFLFLFFILSFALFKRPLSIVTTNMKISSLTLPILDILILHL